MTGQPKDAEESAQWQLEGKTPNSVLIGGKWRTINSVGPQSLVSLARCRKQWKKLSLLMLQLVDMLEIL